MVKQKPGGSAGIQGRDGGVFAGQSGAPVECVCVVGGKG